MSELLLLTDSANQSVAEAVTHARDPHKAAVLVQPQAVGAECGSLRGGSHHLRDVVARTSADIEALERLRRGCDRHAKKSGRQRYAQRYAMKSHASFLLRHRQKGAPRGAPICIVVSRSAISG